jgi:DNA mismatch repair protein MutS2
VRQELAAERDRLALEAADAEKLTRRMAAERAALEEERKTVGRRLKTELEEFRRATRERLAGEVERLRGQMEEGRRKGLEAEAVERLFAEAPQLAPEEEPPEGDLAVGQPARHAQLGWEGIVEKLEPGRAEVLVRGKRVRCRPEELVPVAGAGARKESAASGRHLSETSPAGRSRRGVRLALPAEPAAGRDLDSGGAPPELLLIGQRVEPALEALDAYLDQALLAARREVRVVHGHGTGRLRQAVREHLRSHPAVRALRAGEPNEGGNGATVVTLRGA